MATIAVPPSRNRILPQKPKRGVPRAMTIAVGFLCNNANDLVIATDRQITIPGSHKYPQQKYRIGQKDHVELTFTFAGDPGVFQEVQQKVMERLQETEDLSFDLVRATLNQVLGEVNLRDRFLTRPFDLYLIVGVSELFGPTRLLLFNGRALYEGDHKEVHVIGCGDTSLIAYLASHLYSPNLSAQQGIALAAYMIKQATKFIDYCGEPIDVLHGTETGFEVLPADRIQAAIEMIEAQEEQLATWMIRTPFV